jgi:hypothetical protein
MGVDIFWRRIPEQAVRGLPPKELSDLVPYWFDEEFATLRDAGLLVAGEDTCGLVGALFLHGTAGGRHAGLARWLAAGPPQWDDDHAVGALSPDFVRKAADFLATAPIDDWVVEHREALAADARSMGYQSPFDDEWCERVRRDAHALAALFRAAAERGEAVIEKISA